LVWLCSLACLLLSTLAEAADPNTLTPAELDDGWILLFDGDTDYGWKAGSKVNWKVADGVISATSGEMGLLHTTSEFVDYMLTVAFRSRKEPTGGIFLRPPAKPTSAAKDCYELNIADPAVSPFSTGSFVERKKAEPIAHTDGWHIYTVEAEGGHFTILLDDKQ